MEPLLCLSQSLAGNTRRTCFARVVSGREEGLGLQEEGFDPNPNAATEH